MHRLIFDFLNVTETAALASFAWVGSGNKMEADRAATESMRTLLNHIPMSGTVVIGEGEIDEAPMLYIGERVGKGSGPEIDLAVDPIDGTTPTINGQNDAIAVIAAAPKGTLLNAPDMYMEKIATGPRAKGVIDINQSLEDNLYAVAEASGKQINELTVIIQGRERHQGMIDSIRSLGGKVLLFEEGDVIPAIATCVEHLNIDMFIGIGGAPEGVLAAVGIKSLGGDMQARLLPRTKEEYERCKKMGLSDPEQALILNDLVNADNCLFIATGITNNMLIKGIRQDKNKLITHSILINGKDKKMRYTETEHFFTRKAALTV